MAKWLKWLKWLGLKWLQWQKWLKVAKVAEVAERPYGEPVRGELQRLDEVRAERGCYVM